MTLPLADKLALNAAPVRKIAREAVALGRPHVEEAAASWKRWATRSKRPDEADRVTRLQDEVRRASGSDRRREIVRLSTLASTYRAADDLANARVCAARALEVARDLGDERLLGFTLNAVGLVDARGPAPRPAIAFFEEAREVFRRLGDRQVEGQILANLGIVYDRLGERDRAKATWAEALGVLAADSSAHERLTAWLASHPSVDPAEDETAERQRASGLSATG